MTTVHSIAASEAAAERTDGLLAQIALRFTAWAERWFPDAFVFAAIAVVAVSLAALANGASVATVTTAFGDGFWSLLTFTAQGAIMAISGYVVASSPPAARVIRLLANWPATGRTAVGLVAAVSMLTSLLSWSVSLIFSGLLVREIARRRDLTIDYRAAGAAAYLGMGATWALGISSAAAQLQANPASLPKSILTITGVIPFSQTIFLWQSMAMAITIIVVSTIAAIWSAPSTDAAVTAAQLHIDLTEATPPAPSRERPAEWLEHSPLVSLLLAAIGIGWLVQEFAAKNAILALSNLNTYNLICLMLGLVLHWRPKGFLGAVAASTPTVGGILIQFPLYGAIAGIVANAKNAGGTSLADGIAHLFVHAASSETFPVLMGAYSAVLGFLIPSGGGKWIIEAPYVMQAANELKVHLGWAVQVYNAAEALPNLINPFWMLPLLGLLGLKAREIIGFTFVHFLVHVPLVFLLLWALASTVTYTPPILP
jgi:short-chain fatty acids transporter